MRTLRVIVLWSAVLVAASLLSGLAFVPGTA